MSWELYEVWAVDSRGRDELIDTTKSKKEAEMLARTALGQDCIQTIIYQDVDGNLKEISRLTKNADGAIIDR